MAAKVGCMYGLKPFCDPDSKVPDLPTCMYNMRSYHQADDGSSNLEGLIQKQADILKELESLQQEVSGLATQIGVKLAAQPKVCPGTQDFVISASPADPPLMAISIQQFLHRKGVKHSTATFVHSSIHQTLPEHLTSCFRTNSQDNSRMGPLILSLVWKETDHPFLVLSSISHVPLTGEFTIARHLCRTVAPELYGKLNPEQAASIDRWLDIGSRSFITGNSKEKAAALRSLNSKLGAHEWLVDNSITLADVAVACCVVKAKAVDSAPDNVKKWLKRIPGLEQFI